MCKMEKKIIIMNEGIDFKVENKDDCVNAIVDEYNAHDVSMSEVLAAVSIVGFSAEDVVDIYAECMSISDRDLMVRFTDYTNENTLDQYELEYVKLGVK